LKKILLILIILSFIKVSFAESPPAEKARGVFISFGVGPRLPVNYFANSSDLGYGFNVEFSYTDNEYLPFFLFAKVGFEQFPGSQDYYKITDYSNYNTTSIPVNMGIRYYFAPLLEKVVLFMPVVEVSATYAYYQKLHQFKPSAEKANYTETNSKIGISGGVGISMFMMEIMATYNYFQTNQYVGFDLKIRLPLFISY
jgi:hypothetical protein